MSKFTSRNWKNGGNHNIVNTNGYGKVEILGKSNKQLNYSREIKYSKLRKESYYSAQNPFTSLPIKLYITVFSAHNQ
jgi:hypothetical protein